MRIIGTDRSPQAPTAGEKLRSESTLTRDAWMPLGWLGVTFIGMGVVDIGLGTYPPAFGNSEWEFGVVSSILNGFAIPTMGVYLLLSSAIARGRSRLSRGVAIGMFLTAAALILMGLLYVTVVPIALNAVNQNDVIYLGMKKAVVKALIFMLAYWILYFLGGIKGWKASKVK